MDWETNSNFQRKERLLKGKETKDLLQRFILLKVIHESVLYTLLSPHKHKVPKVSANLLKKKTSPLASELIIQM